MALEHHDLVHEFPEHREKITAMKTSSAHFSRLFDEYHVATREVERLEGIGTPVSDVTLENMKKKRLKLKDELYAMLQA